MQLAIWPRASLQGVPKSARLLGSHPAWTARWQGLDAAVVAKPSTHKEHLNKCRVFFFLCSKAHRAVVFWLVRRTPLRPSDLHAQGHTIKELFGSPCLRPCCCQNFGHGERDSTTRDETTVFSGDALNCCTWPQNRASEPVAVRHTAAKLQRLGSTK